MKQQGRHELSTHQCSWPTASAKIGELMIWKSKVSDLESGPSSQAKVGWLVIGPVVYHFLHPLALCLDHCFMEKCS